MIDKKLSDYIKEHLALGENKELILNSLQNRIWSTSDIEENFNAVVSGLESVNATVENIKTDVPVVPVTNQIPNILTEEPSQVPSPSVVQPISTPTLQTIDGSKNTKSNLPMFAGVVLLLVGMISITAYGYIEKVGPFSSIPYSETDLLSGVISSFEKIKTSTYNLTASVTVSERAVGARSFEIITDSKLAERYKNDSKRASSVQFILSSLANQIYYSKGVYPASLTDLDVLLKEQYSKSGYKYQIDQYAKSDYFRDPVTKQFYEYSVDPDGKNFSLEIDFETGDAIKAISKASQYNSYNKEATSTIIQNKKVTFSKGSYSYFYFQQEPPKPFLATLAEYTQSAPPELNISTSVTAATEIIESKDTNWKFNFDATGDFGDLTYKVGADALKKEGFYYFRINNIPGVFGSTFSSIKGKWVKIDPTAPTSTKSYGYSDLSFVTSYIPEAEKNYKENKEDLIDFLKKIVVYADEEKLISLKNKPSKVDVDGKSLYKYEVSMRKENITSFYKKMTEEASTNKTVQKYDLFNDPATMEYLESKQFDEVFNYINSNVDLVLYISSAGILEGVDYVMHVIPPDTAVPLKDKQVNISFKLRLTDINKPVDIKIPETTTNLEELISQMSRSYYGGQTAPLAGDSKKIAELKAMQLALDQYAEANRGTYPTKLTALTPTYMPVLPSDPGYKYSALGKDICNAYHLGILLEATTSAALDNDIDASPKTECKGGDKDFSGVDPVFDVTGEQ